MKQRPKYRGTELLQSDNEKTRQEYEEAEMTIKSSNDAKTLDIEIKEGDTLQALSIRYHCPVAELKRLNNLHRENEIFARRIIKIPYRTFLMAAVHKSGDNSPETNLPKKSVDANILKQKLTAVSSLTRDDNNVVSNLIDLDDLNLNNFNQIIFNTSIAHKVETEDKDDELISDEEIQLLPKTSDIPQPVTSSVFSCNGADWGLSWPILLGTILIMAFVGPLIYILYIEEHPEKYHHNNS